jgi:hypothetical protein
MTTPRTFLTDEQADALIAALPDPDELPVATLDQIDAASREMASMGSAMALHAAAHGCWALVGSPARDADLRKRMLRPRLKMVLAALSAGVTHLCDHTRQIRPILLTCDPPSLVCMQPACITRAERAAGATPFRWNNSCDSCGRHTQIMTPHLSALGPLTVSGHVCRACSDALADTALQAADGVQVVSRKSPCPCGSGRRYKRCHGRAEEAA